MGPGRRLPGDPPPPSRFRGGIPGLPARDHESPWGPARKPGPVCPASHTSVTLGPAETVPRTRAWPQQTPDPGRGGPRVDPHEEGGKVELAGRQLDGPRPGDPGSPPPRQPLAGDIENVGRTGTASPSGARKALGALVRFDFADNLAPRKSRAGASTCFHTISMLPAPVS